MTNQIYPCLWFDGQAKAAAEFYCSIFENSKITTDTPMVVLFELNGKKFMGLNGGPQFKFNEAISFVVDCELNQDDSALKILQLALSIAPENAMIHYSLGLLWIRQKQTTKAMEELKLAHQLNPVGAREAYVYGVALFSNGEKEKGIQVMEDYIFKHGNDKNIVEALISYFQELGNISKTNFYRNSYELIYENKKQF